MNQKHLATGLLILGVILFPPLGIIPLGAAGFLVSVALLAGGLFLLIQTPKAQTVPLNHGKPEFHRTSSYTKELTPDEEVQFTVFAASSKKPAWTYVAGTAAGFITTILVGFIGILAINVMSNGKGTSGVYFLALIAGVLVGYLMVTLKNNDTRPAAHDTRFYVSETQISNRDGQGKLHPLALSSIDRFVIRNTVTGSGSSHQVSRSFGGQGTNLFAAGAIGEVMSGGRTMPGASGVAVGSSTIAANAAGGAVMGLTNVASASREKAYANHAAWLENNSYLLEAHGGGKANVLAGGMDETTAHGLMTDLARILGLQS